MEKNLKINDLRIIECAIDSNCLNVKVKNANETLKSISEVDLILLDNKKLAKDLKKLKDLLAKSLELSNKITSQYYDGMSEYSYNLRNK